MAADQPKKLIPDEIPDTPFHNLLWAYLATTNESKKAKHFPCRLDKMTEREVKIADVACEVTGTLHFVQDCLYKVLKQLRCEVTNNACGTDTWMAGHPCQCLSCQLWLRMEEVKRSEEKRRRRNRRLPKHSG